MDLNVSNCIELRCYHTWMGKDGIVRTKVKPGSEVLLEDAIENSNCVNGLTQDKFTLIVDARGVKSITKEAREHFSVKGRSSRCLSIAIIVDSHLSRMIANFYIGLTKPVLPVKLFNTEANAVNWCKTWEVVK